ncbi:MAG: hypothetical protein KDE27_05475 [Planctomycetes bacterium]|nr:hypothetical protein [Planctomycetota bacterium]
MLLQQDVAAFRDALAALVAAALNKSAEVQRVAKELNSMLADLSVASGLGISGCGA